MKPRITPPTCAHCDQPATLVLRATRFRQGDRVLDVDGWIWECASRCPDPADGTVPYQFTTFELMSWEDRFAEPTPARAQPAPSARLNRARRAGRGDPRG